MFSDGLRFPERLESRDVLSSISLFADLNTNTHSSEPTSIVQLNDQNLFLAEDTSGRVKLFELNAEELSNSVVKDLDASPLHSECDQIVATKSHVFFFTDQGKWDDTWHSRPVSIALWSSDGTSEGTRQLVSGVPRLDCRTINLKAVGDNAYFQIRWEGKDELWRSDGTKKGTREILSNPTELGMPQTPTRVGGNDVFGVPGEQNRDGTRDWSLWSMGTTGSPQRLPVSLALQRYEVPELLASGDHIYLNMSRVVMGDELLVTDGTPDGTEVLDLQSGHLGSDPKHFHPLDNGDVLFTAWSQDSGRELWRSDGTLAGTKVVRDILAGSDSSEPTNFWQFNGVTYFEAMTLENGREMWRSDGTEAGTFLVEDINPGFVSGGFRRVGNIQRESGPLMLFAATTDERAQIWTSDGTEAGTNQLTDVDGQGFYIRLNSDFEAATIDGMIAFATYRSGEELWFTDGEVAVNSWLKDVNNPNVSKLQAIDGKFFFSAQTSEFGEERFISDGTDEGTRLLEDLNQRTKGASATPLGQLSNGRYVLSGMSTVDLSDGSLSQLENVPNARSRESVVLYDQLIFGSDDGLWSTDGLELKRLATLSRAPTHFQRVGDRVYFLVFEHDHRVLWTTDGTEQATKPVVDLDWTSEHAWDIAEANGKIYFIAVDKVEGNALWSVEADGEAQRVVSRGERSDYQAPVAWNNQIFFLDGPSSSELSLYVTDGTVDAKTQLMDVTVTRILLSADYLYFEVRDSHFGSMLWRTDGTIEGTFELGVPYPREMLNLNGKVYFISTDHHGPRPTELWTTDGTVDGTHEVPGVLPSKYRNYYYLHENNGLMLIYLDSLGGKLWESDGTPEGTQELQVEGYSVTRIQRPSTIDINGSFVSVETFETGWELFRIHSDIESNPTVVDVSLEQNPTDRYSLDSLTFRFDSDVSASLQPSDLRIKSGALYGLAIDTALATMSWDANTMAAKWDLSLVEMGYDTYTLELDSQGVFDQHNNNLDGNRDGINGDPFLLSFGDPIEGDLDLDGTVAFADFLVLSENFGMNDARTRDGDVDGDGRVDFTDFLLLSTNFGTSVEA